MVPNNYEDIAFDNRTLSVSTEILSVCSAPFWLTSHSCPHTWQPLTCTWCSQGWLNRLHTVPALILILQEIFHLVIHSPNSTSANIEPCWYQELGTKTRSPTWVAGTHVCEPTPACFPWCILAGSWIENRARIWTQALGYWHCKQYPDCCTKCHPNCQFKRWIQGLAHQPTG